MSEEIPIEPESAGGSTRLFRISEPDLAELERLLPWMYESMLVVVKNEPLTRKRIRRVMEIMSWVRWDYAPHSSITVIPAGPDDPEVPRD